MSMKNQRKNVRLCADGLPCAHAETALELLGSLIGRW